VWGWWLVVGGWWCGVVVVVVRGACALFKCNNRFGETEFFFRNEFFRKQRQIFSSLFSRFSPKNKSVKHD
jgi:hypothetical protein